MKHYPDLIRLFGALNGLCSSMTENKHIKAVKQPWCRSNRYNALGQMLVTNQRLDKLAALRIDFTKRGMLTVHVLQMPYIPKIESGANLDDGEIDDGPTEVEAQVQLARTCQRKCARTVPALAIELSILHLQELVGRVLFEQLHPCDLQLEGMQGLEVARALCFFSFKYKWVLYECAVIHWFDAIGEAPDEDTGMWIVRPSFDGRSPNISVIHINAIYHAAHLLPIYGTDYIPRNINFSHSLDAFRTFYVNNLPTIMHFKLHFNLASIQKPSVMPVRTRAICMVLQSFEGLVFLSYHPPPPLEPSEGLVILSYYPPASAA
ncbi:hypothetical protein DFH29DRAFT_1007609 [Suillus ampliporus]|nr:hypothetical protein DFH29DRAFT_1007609 [Suillus ampliporus]